MSLEARLAAVERALTDDGTEPAALGDAASVERRLSELEERQDTLEARLADVEASVDSLRGYAGAERREDREVERTAERALASARAVEDRLAEETPPPRREPVVRDPPDSRGLVARLRARL